MTSKQERNVLLDMSVDESSSKSCDLELSYSSSEFETNDSESEKAITPFVYNLKPRKPTLILPVRLKIVRKKTDPK